MVKIAARRGGYCRYLGLFRRMTVAGKAGYDCETEGVECEISLGFGFQVEKIFHFLPLDRGGSDG